MPIRRSASRTVTRWGGPETVMMTSSGEASSGAGGVALDGAEDQDVGAVEGRVDGDLVAGRPGTISSAAPAARGEKEEATRGGAEGALIRRARS
jgi:hypothetical protein